MTDKQKVGLVDAFDPTEIKYNKSIFSFFQNNNDLFNEIFADTSKGRSEKKRILVDLYNKFVRNPDNNIFSKTYNTREELKSAILGDKVQVKNNYNDAIKAYSRLSDIEKSRFDKEIRDANSN